MTVVARRLEDTVDDRSMADVECRDARLEAAVGPRPRRRDSAKTSVTGA